MQPFRGGVVTPVSMNAGFDDGRSLDLAVERDGLDKKLNKKLFSLILPI